MADDRQPTDLRAELTATIVLLLLLGVAVLLIADLIGAINVG